MHRRQNRKNSGDTPDSDGRNDCSGLRKVPADFHGLSFVPAIPLSWGFSPCRPVTLRPRPFGRVCLYLNLRPVTESISVTHWKTRKYRTSWTAGKKEDAGKAAPLQKALGMDQPARTSVGRASRYAIFASSQKVGSQGTTERCPSGRRGRPAKALYGLTPYRGFESLSLRQNLSQQVRVSPREADFPL
jgi:hypothetical protein